MTIWSDKAIDYSAGFTVDPITKRATPNKIGCSVMTIEETLAIDDGFCWNGSDWSEEDLKENDEWFTATSKMLNH